MSAAGVKAAQSARAVQGAPISAIGIDGCAIRHSVGFRNLRECRLPRLSITHNCLSLPRLHGASRV
jgi:hypothetical protein